MFMCLVVDHAPTLHKRHVTPAQLPTTVADDVTDAVDSDYKPELAHWERMEYMHEEPFWKRFLNVNAVIVMTVTVFLYGFFY